MSDRFEELVGPVEDADERARLLRVHELLLAAAPPPGIAPRPHAARKPRRPVYALLAAALAATAFGSGWLLGDRSDHVGAEFELAMAGAEGAEATIEVLPQDAAGNWPLRVLVRGLEPSRDRSDAYELWLTRDGELADSCGVFTVHPGLTIVTLSVPFPLRSYDGWVVTRRGSDGVLLTT